MPDKPTDLLRDLDPGTRPGRQRPARRPADRHYLAVVAAEARRLGRQLRPPMAPGPSAGRLHTEGSH